jgi:hypothetical protein
MANEERPLTFCVSQKHMQFQILVTSARTQAASEIFLGHPLPNLGGETVVGSTLC